MILNKNILSYGSILFFFQLFHSTHATQLPFSKDNDRTSLFLYKDIPFDPNQTFSPTLEVETCILNLDTTEIYCDVQSDSSYGEVSTEYQGHATLVLDHLSLDNHDLCDLEGGHIVKTSLSSIEDATPIDVISDDNNKGLFEFQLDTDCVFYISYEGHHLQPFEELMKENPLPMKAYMKEPTEEPVPDESFAGVEEEPAQQEPISGVTLEEPAQEEPIADITIGEPVPEEPISGVTVEEPAQEEPIADITIGEPITKEPNQEPIPETIPEPVPEDDVSLVEPNTNQYLYFDPSLSTSKTKGFYIKDQLEDLSYIYYRVTNCYLVTNLNDIVCEVNSEFENGIIHDYYQGQATMVLSSNQLTNTNQCITDDQNIDQVFLYYVNGVTTELGEIGKADGELLSEGFIFVKPDGCQYSVQFGKLDFIPMEQK